MTAVFSHGRLRLYLLKLLDDGPKHGYELIRLLEERFLGLYAPSAGTIYPRLQRLEAEGLVTHTAAGGRKVYEITEAGRAELQRADELSTLENDIGAAVEDPPRWPARSAPRCADLCATEAGTARGGPADPPGRLGGVRHRPSGDPRGRGPSGRLTAARRLRRAAGRVHRRGRCARPGPAAERQPAPYRDPAARRRAGRAAATAPLISGCFREHPAWPQPQRG
ncbi:PadR family transcriptional regulator [Micromonospora sp. BRA006-A]|nr:PadR family transcriptional regulator [Micromonospora sp. BRA006-A]